MPGTYVHDAGTTALLASSTKTSTFTGSAIQVDKPGMVRFKLGVTGAVTSDTTASLLVEIQGSNSSAFDDTLVYYGTFHNVAATLGTTAHYLTADVQKQYVRCVGTISGTNTSLAGVSVTVEEMHYQRNKLDTA